MRCGREQHERVGPVGQQPRQPCAARQARLPCPGGHVVALVDDDDVPPGVFEVVAVLQIALERVDGDDAAVEVVERVVVGRDAVAHPRQSHRIEPHQRDGEAAPPFLLELGEHRLLGDHQDALAAAALYQLGGQDAGFQRFAQAHRVGNQDAGAGLLERLQGRVELVRHQVHHAAVAQVNLVVVGHAAPAQALQVQHGGVVGGTAIGHQLRLGGVEHLDGVFQRGQEQC